MKINRNIIKCAGFLLGLVIFVLILSYFFRRKDGLYVYDALSVSVKTAAVKREPDNSLEVLFFGDSESYSSFSPKYLYSRYGYSSFVCGTAAQKVCDSYAILKDCFETQSPKVVVLEANCLFRELNEKESKDIVLNYLTDSLPLFANHVSWKRYARRMLPKSWDLKKQEQRGFIVRKDVKPYKGGKYMQKTNKKEKVSDDISYYLEKIVALCGENDTEFILVSTPSAKNWSFKKHNGVEEWADSHGIAYVDLNLGKEVDINWSKDTKDGGDHLNYRGAKKVTNYIGKYLRDNFSLTDYREVPDYQY